MTVQSLAAEINYQNLEELSIDDIIGDILKLQEESKKSNNLAQEYKTKYWTYYLNPNDAKLELIYGKFMVFYSWNLNTLVKSKLKEMINSGLVSIVKFNSEPKRSCILCLYTTVDENEMKNLCRFMIDSDIVKKTKDGFTFKDIPYKKEKQTRDDQYGDKFNAEIKLSDYIDLVTGDDRQKE